MSGAQYQLTNMENDKGQSTGDLPTIDNDKAKGLADFCRSTPLESKAAILKAMKEFTGNRVNWIKEKSPTMTQIIKEYPQYIEIPEILSNFGIKECKILFSTFKSESFSDFVVLSFYDCCCKMFSLWLI